MRDIEERIKKLEKNTIWVNIYLIALCAGLIGFSLHVWSILLAQETFNNEVVKVLKAMTLK